MLIVYQDEGGIGWSPIRHMAGLAAHSFGADLLVVEPRPVPHWEKLRAVFARRMGSQSCLVIAPYPWDITSFLRVEEWRRHFGRMAAWIIDSFWTDRIPWVSRHVRHFDHLFVTTEEDVSHWERATRTPTSHLPWGTDALGLGSSRPDRGLDLLRVGRQPADWDDDRETGRACSHLGIRFAGRPPIPASAADAQPALMATYAEARYVLAFSNAVNATSYTHPTREYLTGRWVDALACGAVVAGVAPAAPDVRRLLWPGATLELGGIRREEGLQVITEALRDWTPERARLNHRNALERLDWRWRFQVIASALCEAPLRLRAELEELRRVVAGLDAGESRENISESIQ